MTSSQISTLLEKLDELGLKPQVYKNSQYNDEPHFFNYNTNFKMDKKATDGFISEGEPHGSGVSYFSPTEAVSKSIWEAMERCCNYSWHKKNIKYLKYHQEGYKFLDLSAFSFNTEIIPQKMGWVTGIDLFNNKKILIPAQFAYLNYIRKKEPIYDFPYNSTGSAGGNSAEMAILHGIYEIVERDSLLGFYLNKISPYVIDLTALKDRRIDYLIEQFKKYNLELYILDSTTDLGIPSFISILFDRSGAGPAVGIGAKAGFNVKDTIVGAIGEVLMTRLYTKSMLAKGDISPDLKTAKGLFPNRARLWITTDTIKNIEFIVKGKNLSLKTTNQKLTIKNQYDLVLKILKNKGYKVYFVDCTVSEFKKLNFFTYFTIIPGLQLLYLHEGERKRVVNIERLTKIANHFGKEFDGIYKVPHPFL